MKRLLEKTLAVLALVGLTAVPAFGQDADLHVAAVGAGPAAPSSAPASRVEGPVMPASLHTSCAAGSGQMWLPPGTKTRRDDANHLIVAAPAGYRYVGYGTDGNLVVGGPSAKISCNCTQGSGCMPASGAGKAGCIIQDTCSSCLGSTSVHTGGGWTDVTSGGFAQTQSRVGFAATSDLEQGPSVFPALFEVPGLRKEMKAFAAEWGSTDEEAVLVPVQMAGRIGWMPVSEATAIDRNLPFIQTAAASCACDSGSCSLKKGPLGSRFCEGECSGTCTLDTGLKDLRVEATTF